MTSLLKTEETEKHTGPIICCALPEETCKQKSLYETKKGHVAKLKAFQSWKRQMFEKKKKVFAIQVQLLQVMPQSLNLVDQEVDV